MIIPVKVLDNDIPKWVAIELHGNLKSYSEEINHVKKIGEIYFKQNNDVILQIGKYILEGKEVQMKKPLALLKKKVLHGSNANGGADSNREYIVEAIIEKKISFCNRPKPIVVKVPKTSGTV